MDDNSEFKAPSTRDVGLQYGAILGVISIMLFLIPSLMGLNPFKGGWNWVGSAVTVLVIFLAQKKYKDEGNGFMSYGQGLGIALWVALISAPISILFSYGYTSFIDNGPFEMFMIQQEDDMIAKGLSDSMIETSLEWTRKLFWAFGFIGAMFFTMLLALIITLFTKKANPEAPF